MQLSLLNEKRDHVAIMKKEWKLIDKILSKEKTIESRWYKNKVNPWDKINKGDEIYFKDSASPVTIKAEVEEVLQIDNLNYKKVQDIVKTYGKRIALKNTNFEEWYKGKNYCILIFIKNPQKVIPPFNINKNGFGIGCAWITVEDINTIRI